MRPTGVLHRLASICLAAPVTQRSSHFQTPDSLASFRPFTRCLDAFSHNRPFSFSSAYLPVQWGSATPPSRSQGVGVPQRGGLGAAAPGTWQALVCRLRPGQPPPASDELEPPAVAGNSLPQFPFENRGHTSPHFQAVTQALVI